VERVCDFVNELLKLSPRIPKRLIFLATDHAATNPVFRNLVAGICEIQTVECTLRDIGDLLSRENLSIYKLPLFEDSCKRLVDLKAISKVEDQIAYIPRRDELDVNAGERNRLLDSLFRPTHLDWAPYCLDMEFKRDVSADVGRAILEYFADEPEASGRVL
jgi:hypothetical protein